jgi:hypothetical protein
MPTFASSSSGPANASIAMSNATVNPMPEMVPGSGDGRPTHRGLEPLAAHPGHDACLRGRVYGFLRAALRDSGPVYSLTLMVGSQQPASNQIPGGQGGGPGLSTGATDGRGDEAS